MSPLRSPAPFPARLGVPVSATRPGWEGSGGSYNTGFKPGDLAARQM
jgi:hypothetical protein